VRVPDTDSGESASNPSRLLLPVPGLEVSRTWDVGRVRVHPAGSAAELVEQARRGTRPDLPAWFQDRSDQAVAELSRSAVAEVEVEGGIDEAIVLAESALTVMRAVQHIENPTSASRIQTFGLPGQAASTLISYFSLSDEAPGWKQAGVLGGWSFDDKSHAAWTGDPAYRFLDHALKQPDGQRTPLQRRALIAIELLSQAWLSWQPDTAFLSAVMALEVLLGEPGDRDKKFRIARRVSYFICGWLEGSYLAGDRLACPLLALPLRARGEPGSVLEQLIADINAGNIRPCTQFFDVVGLYDARNQIVHGGSLGLTEAQESQATWFIAAWLLRPVLTWFAEHPDAELPELDEEITALSQQHPGHRRTLRCDPVTTEI
jgi:Apea-like HEPN